MSLDEHRVAAGVQASWDGDPPPCPDRLIVVAPHPDDETLGAAGLMTWVRTTHPLGRSAVEVLAVTDGEASHASSGRISAATLRRVRRSERRDALDVLGLSTVAVRALHIPDGRIADEVRLLREEMLAIVTPDAVLVVPSESDGHPDHEAVASVALEVARESGAACWQVPIWSRVRSTCDESQFRVLRLGRDLVERKKQAVRCFASQLIALGPDPVDGPVVPPEAVAALTSSTEWVRTDP